MTRRLWRHRIGCRHALMVRSTSMVVGSRRSSVGSWPAWEAVSDPLNPHRSENSVRSDRTVATQPDARRYDRVRTSTDRPIGTACSPSRRFPPGIRRPPPRGDKSLPGDLPRRDPKEDQGCLTSQPPRTQPPATRPRSGSSGSRRPRRISTTSAGGSGDALAREGAVADLARACRSRRSGAVRYWANDYDFGRVEARLNALPQFLTEIDGLDIHFIHEGRRTRTRCR